jgi:hypothetical protein
VAVGTDGSWIDVVVAGVDPRSHALCERIVAAEVAQLRQIPDLLSPVVVECTTAALSAISSRGPVGLVTVEQRTESQVALDATLHGQVDPPPTEGTEPTATISRTLPFSDTAACERALARIEAEDAQNHAAAKQAVAKFTADQLALAVREQDEACRPAPATPSCASPRERDDRMRCDMQRADRKRACDDATSRRSMLEESGRQPYDPPGAPAGRCVSH